MLTLQQIFDQGVAHLRQQGKPSAGLNSHGAPRCRYRQEDPADPNRQLKCVVGVFIPDDKYDPLWDESGDVEQNLKDNDGFAEALLAGGIDASTQEVQNFLAELQTDVHDDAATVCLEYDWPWHTVLETMARAFATSWGLTYTPPTTGAQP